MNVPIATPSIAIAYEDMPPSPLNMKLGVALLLAVGSEPTASIWPQAPGSSSMRFVVQSDHACPTDGISAAARAAPIAQTTVRRRPQLMR